MPMRDWQRIGLSLVKDHKEPLLVEACPGSGKTRFGLEAAVALILSGEINRVLIIAPTRRIVEQWIEAASEGNGGPSLPLAPAGWRPSQPIFERWCGAAFTYQSLYAQSTMFEALACEPGRRTLVIFDEVHHVGTDSSWGISAQQAFMHGAARILSLSGTAFRTKDPIVFVRTEDGRSVADYRFSYGQALDDQACRPVRFAFIGGQTTFQTPAGSIESVSFDDDLNERGESFRLRTALDASGQHLTTMLDIANEQLRQLRAAGDTDAAGLAVCMDCDHADAVAELLRQRAGVRPPVACSRLNNPEDPTPGPALRNFIDSSDPWLVAVRMVSEGVDIRRLRVVVYATNVVAELTFRQIIGRVVRTDPANGSDDYGVVILPADPRLQTIAERICQEAPNRLVAPIVISDPHPGSGNIFDGRPVAEFRPISSLGELSEVTDTFGRSAPAELVAAAERYVAVTGSLIPAFELALAAANDPSLKLKLLAY
jgi:superfamily II DNA or RNA helicase